MYANASLFNINVSILLSSMLEGLEANYSWKLGDNCICKLKSNKVLHPHIASKKVVSHLEIPDLDLLS